MPSVLVRGGHRLKGEVRAAGSTDAALPLLAATLLSSGTSVVRNLPTTGHVAVMRELLGSLGCTLDEDPGATGSLLRIDASAARPMPIGYDLVRRLGAAVLLLAPLLARFGEARIALPGSTAQGTRPIDPHLRGLEAMGVRIRIERGDVVARAARKLQGTTIVLAAPSVSATLTLMMAGTLARGRTQIEGAARDPEIEAVAQLLNKMGARVQGAGTSLVTVEGVAELGPFDHAVPPDRTEAGMLLCAAALTRGDVFVRGAIPEHLDAVLGKLRSAGAEIVVEDGGVRARGPAELRPIDLQPGPYPAFPIALQPTFLVVAARARGQSMIGETAYDGRFESASELVRMGAQIHVDEGGRTALASGPAKLQGVHVRARDPRSAAALLVAGLCAEGETVLEDAAILQTTCERLPEKLAALGADVRFTPPGLV